MSVLQIWKDYDEEAEAVEAPTDDSSVPLKREYIDVIISDVRTANGLSFSVQILNTEGVFQSVRRTTFVNSLQGLLLWKS